MALFNSSNPTFKDSVLTKSKAANTDGNVMTINGTIMKTLLLLGMAIIAASVTWRMAFNSPNPAAVQPWIIGGAIAGFIMAIVISFKPTIAPWAAPIYAALEGLFLGGVSAIFEQMFADRFPGIVITAVSITLLTMLIMLTLYRSGVIRVTERFKSIIITAITAIFIFYVARIVLYLFGVNTPFGAFDSSWLSIGISVVIVVIAALTLLLDFDFIEKGAAVGAPKYMEWYGAFGLMVTLVWLYLEILKLLAKISRR